MATKKRPSLKQEMDVLFSRIVAEEPTHQQVDAIVDAYFVNHPRHSDNLSLRVVAYTHQAMRAQQTFEFLRFGRLAQDLPEDIASSLQSIAKPQRGEHQPYYNNLAAYCKDAAARFMVPHTDKGLIEMLVEYSSGK